MASMGIFESKPACHEVNHTHNLDVDIRVYFHTSKYDISLRQTWKSDSRPQYIIPSTSVLSLVERDTPDTIAHAQSTSHLLLATWLRAKQNQWEGRFVSVPLRPVG